MKQYIAIIIGTLYLVSCSYKDNGTSTEKMLALYHQGQSHHANAQYAQALACYCDAIEVGKESDDVLAMSRVYDAQGDLYSSLTQWEKAVNSKLLAADYFSKSDSVDCYANCLLDVFNAYTQSENYSKAEEYLNECNDHLENVSSKTLSKYYSCYLNYLIATDKLNVIENTIQEYLCNVSEDDLDCLSLAYAYMALGDYDKVVEALSKNELTDGHEDILRQCALVDALNAHIHEGRDMLESCKASFYERDSLIYSLYENDVRYMQQKHAAKLQQDKEEVKKHTKTIVSFACVLALLVSLYVLKAVKKRLRDSRAENVVLENEKTLYENMYKEVLAERDTLNAMLVNYSMREETMTIVRKRLEVLNAIVVSYLSDRDSDNKRANEQLQNLVANREAFIKSTRLTLEENYPHFFAYLRNKGLSEFEIDFCCLYAIGMKGKEVKAYTNLSRHYKDSSEVRQKLGLVESDTNLANFLQKLLKNG